MHVYDFYSRVVENIIKRTSEVQASEFYDIPQRVNKNHTHSLTMM